MLHEPSMTAKSAPLCLPRGAWWHDEGGIPRWAHHTMGIAGMAPDYLGTHTLQPIPPSKLSWYNSWPTHALAGHGCCMVRIRSMPIRCCVVWCGRHAAHDLKLARHEYPAEVHECKSAYTHIHIIPYTMHANGCTWTCITNHGSHDQIMDMTSYMHVIPCLKSFLCSVKCKVNMKRWMNRA